MTVAAVVVPDSVEQALEEAAGRIAVRRIIDAAWAGGALPIAVVIADEGSVAGALEGSPAFLVDPRGDAAVAAYRRGAAAARTAVRETSAILLWPGRMTWIDPETVTSLIEAHGRAGDRVLRPRRAGEPGWPVLIPSDRVDALLAEGGASIEDALASAEPEAVELGDPGSLLGIEVPFDELPDYAGPPEPVGGPPPEWGAAAADRPDPGLGD